MGRLFRILQELQIPPRLSAIHFGSLITNPTFPHQGYFDPSSISPHPQPHIEGDELTNFEEMLASLHEGKLEALLTRLATASLTHQAKKQIKLSTCQIKDYRVDNSDAWFDIVCGMPDARKWMEQAIKDDKVVYLVVGCRTFLDTEIYRAGESTTSGSGKGVEPSQGFGGGAQFRHSHGDKRGYQAPDERVFAVQYREVKFRYFSSKDVDTAFLEQNNRWKQLARLRGPVMKDVIEPNLNDMLEFGDGYERVASGDGSDEYVYHSG